MEEDFTYDVFLSHSSKDKPVVRDVAERLRRDGLRVWFDEWELKPGDSIPSKIEEGLKHSRVLVLCMSADAFGSDWAKLESYTFRFRDPLNKDRRFIPLRLDDSPIDDAFAQFVYIDWLPDAHDTSYPQLLESCRPPASPSAMEEEAGSNHVAEQATQLGYGLRVWSYAFSPDGKHALVGDSDGTIVLWDMEARHRLRVLKGHTQYVWVLKWSSDQRLALSGSGDATTRLWDVRTGRCLRVLEGHTGFIEGADLSGDQRLALSGASDHTVRLWDVQTGQCLRILEGH